MQPSYIKSLTISRSPAGAVNRRQGALQALNRRKSAGCHAVLRGDMAKSVTIPT
jgi:hypothetical protein